MLKFGCKHESESDEMGLIFMNRAGYDPYFVVSFWTKMSKQGGQKPTELMSTDPSDERRIADIRQKLIEMETTGEINSTKK